MLIPAISGLFAFQQMDLGWVGPATALSLVFIAVAIATAVGAGVYLLLRIDRATEAMSRHVAELRTRLEPAARTLQELGSSGRTLAVRVEDEVSEVLRTSRKVRHDVERGFDRAKARLEDLDALIEVVQDEVEETALDVAATLRTVRKGKGVVGRLRRLLRGRR